MYIPTRNIKRGDNTSKSGEINAFTAPAAAHVVNIWRKSSVEIFKLTAGTIFEF